MRITTTLNNFSRGQIDHNLQGRIDLPIYQSGSERFKNFFSNFQGNALFRSGFEWLLAGFDCHLIEFRFNFEQSYLLVLFKDKMRFLSFDVSGNFGWVMDGANPLEVATPYTLAESKEVQVAQNADVMYFVHPSHAPRKLTRTGAAAFTFATYSRTNDPFTGAGLYPSCVCFHKARLWFGAPSTKITTIYGSKVGAYDDFSVSSPIVGDDAITLNLTEISEKILWLVSGANSLIAGSAEGIVPVNGGGTSEPITALAVEAIKAIDEGAAQTIPLCKDGLLLFIGSSRRNVYAFSYDLLSERYIANDLNVISHEITSGKMYRMRRVTNRNDLIFILSGDGRLLSLNFSEQENIIGWHQHETDGEFQQIAVIPDNNGNLRLFALIKRGNDYSFEVLTEFVEFPIQSDFYTDDEEADKDAYARFCAEKLKDCVYVDSALTYNDLRTATITFDGTDTITADADSFVEGDVGKRILYKTATGYEWGYFDILGYTDARTVTVEALGGDVDPLVWSSWYLTFQNLSGLTIFEGKEVAVVADGGFLNDFTVTDGEIDLGQQVGHVVVGLKYTGEIKTMNLGFAYNGENTQITAKTIYNVTVRFSHSAGGLAGSSKYSMLEIQKFTPDGLLNIPPLPMDGDKSIAYNDATDYEKVLYIQQKEPLPLNITSVFLKAKYESEL